jgi:hypothetical protein
MYDGFRQVVMRPVLWNPHQRAIERKHGGGEQEKNYGGGGEICNLAFCLTLHHLALLLLPQYKKSHCCCG